MRSGDLASDFTLPDQRGVDWTLSTMLAAGPVVLFFYPAAMTTGCTKEACHFRDLGAEFAALRAQRVGISMDGVERQAQFSSQGRLDFPLLADVDGEVARRYGVKRSLDFLKVKRVTFVIGQDRRIIEVVSSEMMMDVHADRALAALASHAS